VLFAVLAVMSAAKPSTYLSIANFNSMMRQFPDYGIMAIGVSLTMITGGIDLAVVGTANLSSIVAAKFLIAFVPRGAPASQVVPMLIAAVLLALATGALCGAFSGFSIAQLRISPILATLGAQLIFTGIAIVTTEGKPQSRLPLLYSKIGNAALFHLLPLPVFIFAAVAILIGLVLAKTRFGFQAYMVGTNSKAAYFAGLSIKSVLFRAYVISGTLSSVAGLILMARVNSAKADYGAPYTLQCILIAVLGGIDPAGGFGTIRGVTLAVLILQFLSSGINMFEQVDVTYRDMIWGAVLILALIFAWIIQQRSKRRQND
jgi:simple sugar transport system permease protein